MGKKTQSPSNELLKIPSIFSVQRCFIISDALMYNLFDDGRRSPVNVIRHGILGTQNVKKDTDVKNPQRTESAKTDPDAIGLQVEFSLATVLLKNAIFASSSVDFRQAVDAFINRFSESKELHEICRRYACNILNGRWLWRNRILAQDIVIDVTLSDRSQDNKITRKITTPSLNFDNISKENNNDSSQPEYLDIRLGNYLKEGFTRSPQLMKVRATLKFGYKGAIEVFPSQNFVSNKPAGFARSLYKVKRIDRETLLEITRDANPMTFLVDIIDMGQAAIRDQKIGNAIRTIDTWYKGDEEAPPIPVEPKGANIETNEYKRKNNNDLFTMLEKINTLSPAIDRDELNTEAMFVLANIIRGFLAGEKDESKGDESAKGKNKKQKHDSLEEVTTE